MIVIDWSNLNLFWQILKMLIGNQDLNAIWGNGTNVRVCVCVEYVLLLENSPAQEVSHWMTLKGQIED